MAWFILCFSLGYALLAFILHRAKKPKPVNVSFRPRVAVLVAMRNEEKHIADCLSSLARQSYPQHLYDVYVLDDRSQDASPAIVDQFRRRYAHIRLIPVKEDKYGLRGKMNALAQGMKQVHHEIILITDADCVVPESWVENMVAYFDSQTGMVGALTILYPFDRLSVTHPQKNWWAKLQTLDWIFLQTMAAVNSNFGKPITILGNNFAFRRQAYLQVGGFESLGFSVTEDFALMEAVRKKTPWKIRHTLDVKNAVYSHPLPTLSEFFRQRHRWMRGGKKARPWGIFILSFAVLSHAAFWAGLITAPENPLVWTALLALVSANAFSIRPVLKRMQLRKLWIIFPLFEIFYMAYLFVFSILFFLPLKVSWKGRTFGECDN